jgi:hypothetical protein
MFKTLIPDEFAFNKHVRGETDSTYKKLIKAHTKTQGKSSYRVTLSKITDVKAEAESLIRLRQAQAQESKKQLELD